MAPYSAIESLAGAFHPHAIEVQDFSYYALVIDVRSREEYEDDHIPGAVCVELSPLDTERQQTPSDDQAEHVEVRPDEGTSDLPTALAEVVKPVKLDQAILIYCGSGGRVSLPLAQGLRWRGWTVDVLPGGWINYRRWVQAGLDVLPRLVTFRVIASSLGTEAARVLRALREVGHQVLDVEGLAGRRRAALGAPSVPQPPQAWFESQLLQAFRGLDPRAPVWIEDLGVRVGSLMLPGALTDALSFAPAAALEVVDTERVLRWREDEPLLRAEPSEVIDAVASLSPRPSDHLLTQWRRLATKGITELLVGSMLSEYIDRVYADEALERSTSRHALPALAADSLAPSALAASVRVWLPGPASSPAPG
jgi:tRNA 2-selenouridine synthase